MALQLDTFDKKEQIVASYMSMMKNAFKESYYKNSNSFSVIDLKHEQLQCEQSLKRDMSHISSSIIDDMLIQNNINTNEVSREDYKQLDRLYLREKIDMLQDVIHVVEPQAYKITEVHSSPALTSVQKLSGVSFYALYQLFLKEKQKESPNICTTTWRDYQSAYDDFIYVLGDEVKEKDVSLFTKGDIKLFANAIHNMPSSRTKKKIYRDMPYSELIAMNISNADKMATNTKKKKISTIRQIFDLALSPLHGYIEENHVVPFIIKEKYGKRSTNITRN